MLLYVSVSVPVLTEVFFVSSKKVFVLSADTWYVSVWVVPFPKDVLPVFTFVFVSDPPSLLVFVSLPPSLCVFVSVPVSVVVVFTKAEVFSIGEYVQNNASYLC